MNTDMNGMTDARSVAEREAQLEAERVAKVEAYQTTLAAAAPAVELSPEHAESLRINARRTAKALSDAGTTISSVFAGLRTGRADVLAIAMLSEAMSDLARATDGLASVTIAQLDAEAKGVVHGEVVASIRRAVREPGA